MRHPAPRRPAPLLCPVLLTLFAPLPDAAGDPSPTAGTPGGPPLALRAAKVLTVARQGPAVLDRAVVVVQDGRIAAVGGADLELPAGAEELDLGDRWLMPGMIDLHCHVAAGSVFSGNELNSAVYLTNPGLRVRAGVIPDNTLLQRAVAGGVTTVLYIPGSASNMGGQGVLLKTAGETYDELLVRDPGSLKLAQAGNPEDFGPGVGRSFMNWNTRNTFRRGLAYARRWQAFEAGEGPEPEVDVQFEVFRELLEGRTQVSTHTQVYQVVLMTITMVRVDLGLDVFIDHGTFDGYLAAELAEEAGVPAILGPRMIDFENGWSQTDGKVHGVAAGYQERGHTAIGFNTDCIDAGETGWTPPAEEFALQAGMAVRYGLRNEDLEAVRGLTIVPAETVGLGDRLGSIEVGKEADLVVLQGDPADPRNAVELVFIAGKRVYDCSSEPRRW